MNFRRFIHKKSLSYHRRHFRLVAAASAVAVAVILGSLIVGDSVRGTLRDQVTERLGQTNTIISAGESYISDSILEHPLLKESSEAFLVTQGFVSHYGKLVPVMVWGADGIEDGSAEINEPLSDEIGGVPSSEIIIRLPSAGLVPSGSLFVTDSYTTSMRLPVSGVRSPGQGGNLNLKNEQIQPFNVFVPRHLLADLLDLEGWVNLILSEETIDDGQFAQAWNFGMSGLKVSDGSEGFSHITSSRIFIKENVAEAIVEANPSAEMMYSYLGNSISAGGESVPYSFITALQTYKGRILEKEDVILSDYTADRLGISVGDSVSISYFRSGDLKNLTTDSVRFSVSRIVPVGELAADKGLSAEYPGLSNVERCTDWDSDLPLDMELITAEDEDYWEVYRQTPKALLPYVAVASDWSDGFGSATAIRIYDAGPDLSGLTHEMFGVQITHPREDAVYAAENGVDFSSLFLALGCFIIFSALLLMFTPLSEMYSQRRKEFETLSCIGFSRRRIDGILFRESLPVVAAGSAVGVILGIIYTGIILWMLEGVWKGATHTASFTIHFEPVTIIAGTLVSFVLVLGVLALAIRNAHDEPSKASVKAKGHSGFFASFFGALAVATYVHVLVGQSSVLVSVLAGLLLMLALVLASDSILTVRRARAFRSPSFDMDRILNASLFYSRRQSLLALVTLASGVFIVFVVGLNRRSFADMTRLETATGGYTLWVETSMPFYHDPSTEEGREELSLTASFDKVLPFLRYAADDASCLNLNKVEVPTVLGADLKSMSSDLFALGDNIYNVRGTEVYDMLSQSLSEDVYPVLADASTMIWSIMKQLGDTLTYRATDGRDVSLVLAGTLSSSVLQGNVIMDKTLFSEIWPELTGCSLFLARTEPSDKSVDEASDMTGRALYDYGPRVMPASERLRQLGEVTDTYLSIFMTLGSIGLLLGLFSFMIVVRKNLTRSRQDIRYYLLLGFPLQKMAGMLFRENVLVPRLAVLTGLSGAVFGIGRQIAAVGIWVWVGAAFVTVLLLWMSGLFIRRQIQDTINH